MDVQRSNFPFALGGARSELWTLSPRYERQSKQFYTMNFQKAKEIESNDNKIYNGRTKKNYENIGRQIYVDFNHQLNKSEHVATIRALVNFKKMISF